MARTKGARDRRERKNSITRNLKAAGINAARGILPGALIGGLSLPTIRAGVVKGSLKGAAKGAAVGGILGAGLNELAWRAGGEGRKKAGYGDADRYDIASNPNKYVSKLMVYQQKELAKKNKKRK